MLLIPHLTMLCNFPGGLLKGQTLMQLEQSVLLCAQKSIQVSALMCQVSTPLRLEILCGSSFGLPYMILLLGHFFAHFSQTIQNSFTPNSIGRSEVNGKSVKTFASRTLGPYSGVISNPFRAISPSPASMAMGMLQAVSFPHGRA